MELSTSMQISLKQSYKLCRFKTEDNINKVRNVYPLDKGCFALRVYIEYREAERDSMTQSKEGK